jgi:Kef-type K+ transport system membrane component KefB
MINDIKKTYRFSHPFVGSTGGRFHPIYRALMASNFIKLRELPMNEILAEAVNRLEGTLIVLTIIIVVRTWIAERLRRPGPTGLVLGRYVLGPLLEGSLVAIGGIELLFLMFIAGAELDLNLFQRYSSAALAFGLMTFLTPFLLQCICFEDGATGSDSTGIGVGLTYPGGLANALPGGDLGQQGRGDQRGVTVITDTLASLVLAVVSALARDRKSGGHSSPVAIVVKLLIGYCMVFLPCLARWFYAGPGQDRLPRLFFVIGALTSAGVLAALVGMDGIVGAFFAGL